MDNDQHRTYQCRINVTGEENVFLESYAALYGKAARTLFSKLRAGKSLAQLKRQFLPKFGLTARQFNSLAAEIRGKISSIKERRSGRINELEHKIERATSVLKKITNPFKIHQKKRRLATLEARLSRLTIDHVSGVVRLCFGSRKLFRAQYSLEENGYASRASWKEAWHEARNNQFFVVGSKDETGGCQGCAASVMPDGSVTLRLRLPNASTAKYATFHGLRFPHGHEKIVAAIGNNLSRKKQDWQAISYRFLKDDQGWRVFASVALREAPRVSGKDGGVIGLDINGNHLAATETDRFGNPVGFFSVPCVTYGKSAKQRAAIIGDAVREIMAFAIKKQKPLVIEKLDFQKKKAALEKESPKKSRMLSSLAYTMVQTVIRARAFDAGIEVHEVNPAYTSVIGRYKFAARYGMSAHHASALVIGRRRTGFGEKLPSQLHNTLPLPVRNRSRHVWSRWAAVSRNAKAALAAHGWPTISRSLPFPGSQRVKAQHEIMPSAPVRTRHANRHEHCSRDVMAIGNNWL